MGTRRDLSALAEGQKESPLGKVAQRGPRRLVSLVPTREVTCLSHVWIADTNFFQLLDAEDARIAAAVKAANCPDCGGRLDQANYPRKPRGGEVGAAGEILDRRRSFSCCREGCRHRRTPASLVFLGRRVYLAVTVVVMALRAAVPFALAAPASPPRRTLRRWLAWFAFELPVTGWFTTVRARLSPRLEPDERLPGALVDRLRAHHAITDAILATLRLFAPLSSVTRTRATPT